jgi:hypothetical protein
MITVLLITYIFCVLSFFIIQTKQMKLIQNQNKKINHLQYLLNIVANGICSPIHRQLYIKVLEKGYETLPTNEEFTKIYQDLCFKKYQEERKILIEKIAITTDVIEKDRLSKVLKAMDDSQNLLSTLSSESSQEYTNQVISNVSEIFKELNSNFQ